MVSSLEDKARRKIEEAVQEKTDKEEKANAAIWTAVAVSATLGAIPPVISHWGFIGVNTVLIVALGSIYGHHMTKEGAAHLIKQIFVSAGATWIGITLGMTFFAQVLKGVGVVAMTGPTFVGLALDAALCSAVTFAIGFTVKEYFKKNKQMSQEEMRSAFRSYIKEGRKQIKLGRS